MYSQIFEKHSTKNTSDGRVLQNIVKLNIFINFEDVILFNH